MRNIPSTIWLIPLAIAAVAKMASAEDWKLPDSAPLLTRWSKQVGPHNALPEYPRPQMARESWQNLNGLWDYALTSKQDDKIPAKLRWQDTGSLSHRVSPVRCDEASPA